MKTTLFWYPQIGTRLLLPLLAVLGYLAMATVSAQAAPAETGASVQGVSSAHHRWAHFLPSAWNTARTVTETFDDAGNTVHVTTATVTTTLAHVLDNGYGLRMETSLDIDGKRLSSPAKTINYDLFDRSGLAATVAVDDTPVKVEIDGRSITCRVLRLVARTGQEQERTTIYYSTEVAPYLLRREIRTTDLAGKVLIDQTTEVVTHLQLRRRVIGSLEWTAEVKTVRRNSKGSTITLAYLCEAIPGGVVDRMSTEFDAKGNVIRSSTLELIGYGCQCKPTRVFPRLRPRRRFRNPR